MVDIVPRFVSWSGLEPHISAGCKALDVGCGIGGSSRLLAKRYGGAFSGVSGGCSTLCRSHPRNCTQGGVPWGSARGCKTAPPLASDAWPAPTPGRARRRRRAVGTGGRTRGSPTRDGLAASRARATHTAGPVSFQVTLSPEQMARGTALIREQGLADKVDLRVADALALPFADNTFDAVWACESGEHMPDKDKFIAEATRVLKPGGRLMVITWCKRAEPPALSASDARCLAAIYDEWALPFFITVPEYESIFARHGLGEIRSDDWSKAVWWTWVHSIIEGAKGLPWLLAQGPIVFWRTLRDVYGVVKMIQGYRSGAVVYGLITGVKRA